jgi:hypothetical protein
MADIIKPKMINDDNGKPVPVMSLSDSQVVDGTIASVQSVAINGTLVRIVSMDNNLTVLTGADPTALTTSIFIPALGELWLPIVQGHKVAVLGGKANICTAGV